MEHHLELSGVSRRADESALASDVVYLDLDGDGVPDAVMKREVLHRELEPDGQVHVIETRTTIDAGIDIDGVPSSTEITHVYDLAGGTDASARSPERSVRSRA
jgi:hypothetical protein